MHEIPLNELKTRLLQLDEYELLDILGLTGRDLISELSDYIAENYEEILERFPDEEDPYEEGMGS